MYMIEIHTLEELVTDFPLLAKDFTFRSPCMSVSSNFYSVLGVNVIVNGDTIFSIETEINDDDGDVKEVYRKERKVAKNTHQGYVRTRE
jgi:hypothetical protein